MKHSILRHKFALWLVAALALTACSQDELMEQGTPLPIGQYPLELVAHGLQAVATPAQPTTRGTFFEGDWDGVTSVRVRVNDQQEKEYSVTPSEDKKTADLAPAEPLGLDDNLFWWNSTSEEKTVMAWTPSNYVLGEIIEFPTEWKEEHFTKYDIIGANKTIKFTDRNEPLAFQHLMAKIVINLRETEYLKAAKNVEVQLNGSIWKYGTMSIKYGQLKIASESSKWYNGYITPYPLPEGEYEEVNFGDGQPEKPFASYTALVFPGYAYISPLLIIEVDGIKYQLLHSSFTEVPHVEYKAGQVYTFNVTVDAKGLNVTVEEGNIGWTQGDDTGNGETEL